MRPANVWKSFKQYSYIAPSPNMKASCNAQTCPHWRASNLSILQHLFLQAWPRKHNLHFALDAGLLTSWHPVTQFPKSWQASFWGPFIYPPPFHFIPHLVHHVSSHNISKYAWFELYSRTPKGPAGSGKGPILIAIFCCPYHLSACCLSLPPIWHVPPQSALHQQPNRIPALRTKKDMLRKWLKWFFLALSRFFTCKNDLCFFRLFLHTLKVERTPVKTWKPDVIACETCPSNGLSLWYSSSQTLPTTLYHTLPAYRHQNSHWMTDVLYYPGQ